MSDSPPSDETRFVHLDETPLFGQDATLTMAETASDESEAAGQGFGMGKGQLVDRYNALLSAGAIYYPVAYQFLEELGRGRQGIVFLGLRQGSRGCITRHALKVYDPSIYGSAERYWTDMGRIASQISKLQTVRTPHLVSREVYEESNGIGYVQMEYIHGMDIHQLLRRKVVNCVRERSTASEWSRFSDVIFRIEGGQLSIQPGVVIHILRQILRGLEVLHDSGFVHSDIKPANVMIDQLGIVKVIDYGRAVRLNEKVSILLGTPHYMAPETHRRQASGAQADLYSVGILGLEMLKGRSLFTCRNEEELLEAKLRLPDELEAIVPLHVRESEALMNVIRTLIDPNPENRYVSSREAESSESGLSGVNRQLVMMKVDANYERELQNYLAKAKNPLSKRIEM